MDKKHVGKPIMMKKISNNLLTFVMFFNIHCVRESKIEKALTSHRKNVNFFDVDVKVQVPEL